MNTLENSPLPNHMAISGIQPSMGTWRMEWSSGPISRSATRDSAISTPRATPKTMPKNRPLLF
ncbi:hypothetical protein D3C80_1879160 [compost metagenome]